MRLGPLHAASLWRFRSLGIRLKAGPRNMRLDRPEIRRLHTSTKQHCGSPHMHLVRFFEGPLHDGGTGIQASNGLRSQLFRRVRSKRVPSGLGPTFRNFGLSDRELGMAEVGTPVLVQIGGQCTR